MKQHFSDTERSIAMEELEHLIECIKKWEHGLSYLLPTPLLDEIRKEMRKAIDP